MGGVAVHLPDEPYVDTEALRTDREFQEFARSNKYAAWAALERVRAGYAEPDGHVRAWRERRR